jgi:hypothetical protein
VAAFFKSNQSPAPLVDETDPTQIRTQIRRFGESDTDRETDGLLHAALFIAMAHDYDAHQETLSIELETIGNIERQMYSGLSGEASAMEAPFSSMADKPEKQPFDPGLYLAEKRIQAWALLALHALPEAWLYLTTSRAVFESLCDALPQAVHLLRWDLGQVSPARQGLLLDNEQRSQLKSLAFCQGLRPIPSGDSGQPSDAPGPLQLSIFGLADNAPHAVLRRLAVRSSLPPNPSQAETPVNMLFGYLGK